MFFYTRVTKGKKIKNVVYLIYCETDSTDILFIIYSRDTTIGTTKIQNTFAFLSTKDKIL